MICKLCFEDEVVQDENVCEKCLESNEEDIDLSLDDIIKEINS